MSDSLATGVHIDSYHLVAVAGDMDNNGGIFMTDSFLSQYYIDSSGSEDTLAHLNNVTTATAQSAETPPIEMKAMHVPTIEEDDSNLSSSGTDLFDRSSGCSVDRKSRWKLDTHGNWRHRSSESATSTGISSICSSIAAEETKADRVPIITSSKKRMSDGSLKKPVIRLSSRTNSTANPVPSSQTAPQVPSQPSPNTPPKRRGRPPKDKSGAPGFTPKIRRASQVSTLQTRVRPRSSIPHNLPAATYASQSIEAAHASRLDPFSLHPGEHRLLADLITSTEVTVYLNIRNAILRLWTVNPRCSVTAEEAAGCAKEGRFFGLAEVAYKWLVRNGYINFGCVELPQAIASVTRSRKLSRQKTVVVIGAGVSGLATARQLEGLFAQMSERWTDLEEKPPRVIVLEGRKRIGGRVYSKPLRSQIEGSLPGNLRNTVEMGAMIVTGFEHGNPLDAVIRAQLGLRYHLMKDALTIYDYDGKAVNAQRDHMNTELYADISDRAGEFRAEPQKQKTLRGDEVLIQRCRDPVFDGYASFQLEPLFDPADTAKQPKPTFKRGRRRNAPPGTEKLTGRSQVLEAGNATQRAARAAQQMGWRVQDGVSKNHTVTLRPLVEHCRHPTLGTVMDEAIMQYQNLVELTPQDMRLLNWHHANLEYANAAPVTSLSLSGHDQDTGNEFEGAHSEIIGGYTQVPRGLMFLPTKLDVRLDKIVESIHYNESGEEDSGLSTKVVCTNGEVIEADEVVMTAPLGVLKADTIDFDPPLAQWKQGAIDRMGFGLLNKVVLLYDQPFWDDSRDMFGMLNEAECHDSIDPAHHEAGRGRFYLIWNASKTSGRPVLIALMAGHAAYSAEVTDTSTLLNEITDRLRKVFTLLVPMPREVIVTRWKQDKFTRGTYSFVGPYTQPDDYDLMAKSVGNLHFAGEATCGTHPATVHGAFLSGLRVAADVVERMAGPIKLPSPLVGASTIKQEMPPSYAMAQPAPMAPPPKSTRSGMALASTSAEPVIKQEPDTTPLPSMPSATPLAKAAGPPRKSVCSTDPSFWARASFNSFDLSYEAHIIGQILGQLGERPTKPTRPGVNPFLLYTKAKWDEVKAYCSAKQEKSGGSKPAPKNMIRATIGAWWRALSEEEKEPYLMQSQAAQEQADVVRKEWEQKVAQWDLDATRLRNEYIRLNPPADSGYGKTAGSSLAGGGTGVSKRKTNVSNCVALDVPGL